MNKWIGTGRLGKEPEVRYTQSGKCVANFDMAVTDGYGEQQKTNWIPVVAWEKLGESCGNNLTKGSRVLVDGKIQIRSYETNDGKKRRVTEIVAHHIEFLDRKQSNEPSGNSGEIDINSFGKDVFPQEEIPF